MFGFLAPFALFGLALLAIPLVLHIFKPRKVRELPFSSLRWLRASQHRMSKKIRLHQVLLLLLRGGFITALVLALAAPVLSSRDGGQWKDRFVVLDVGAGMGYDDGIEPAPLERGKAIAGRLVNQVSPGDRTALLRVGTHVRSYGPMVGDAGAYLNELEAAEVEAGGARLTDVLRMVEPLRQAGEQPGEAIELFFITDNATHKWSQGAIDRFIAQSRPEAAPSEAAAGERTNDTNDAHEAQASTPIDVNVIDVSPERVENAWIADARLIERHAPRRRVLRVRVGAVGQEAQARALRLSGLDGVSTQTQQLTVEPGAFARVQFELPEDYDTAGQVARLELAPHDNLPADDTYWVNLDTTAVTRVLVIEPNVTQVTELQPGHHLRTALHALDAEGHATLEIVRASPDEVLGDEIAAADAVVMVEVPELSSGDLQLLEQRVQDGAGLAVFLGPSIDVDFYNNELHDPLRPNDSLSPVQLGEAVQERDHSQLAGIDSEHGLFRGLSDPLYGDLDGTRFTRYFQLDVAEGVRDARPLAHIGEREPAIIERSLGAGRVMVFNASANDAWTDLPRRRSYLPFVRQMLSQLAGGLRQGAFTVGAAATVPLPAELSEAIDPAGLEDASGLSVDVRTPGGERLTPTVQPLRGRPVIRFDTLDEVGMYRVSVRDAEGAVAREFPFVVQPDAAAHSPTRLDAETLEAWWEPANVNVVRPASPGDVLASTDTRWLLTPWLLALAALLLAAEMFFVHYLCPRANPALAESVLNRRGFFGRAVGDATRGGAALGGSTDVNGGAEGVAPSPTA